eukprot:6179177-Pleurochrysis_carterae.AAC.2
MASNCAKVAKSIRSKSTIALLAFASPIVLMAAGQLFCSVSATRRASRKGSSEHSEKRTCFCSKVGQPSRSGRRCRGGGGRGAARSSLRRLSNTSYKMRAIVPNGAAGPLKSMAF